MQQETADEVIKRLSDSEDLIDIMMDVEDYLDGNNIYAFANWLHGELVGGPYIKKYWITVMFKWPYEKMPDPRAARRLLAQGTHVTFEKTYENESVKVLAPSDYQPGTKKPRLRRVPVWLVVIKIPRRFVQNLNQQVLDLYDHEVDIETIETAQPQELEQQLQQGQSAPATELAAEEPAI
tara:strand:+ start:6247 stop:6786 length:540 start_codon:yes stop_codon:yes gene_type:complete